MPETGRILEFPRFPAAPLNPVYELAEPIADRPRIVEAPEVTPPPPALGGITLEAEKKEVEKRPGFEIPLQPAPLARRVLAAAIDGVVVLSAGVLFAYIFVKMTMAAPPLAQIRWLAIGILAWLWAAYQCLLLILSGSTLGLLIARLRVSYFDGSPVGRRMRRWRVLASLISAISLGLGFAWCFLDEDALSWHDRITHTYLAPQDRLQD